MLTIGQLSKQVSLPTKTIRFYEEIGLISQPSRAENGYRIYPESSIEELSLIKNARDLGLPIPEIKKLMVGCIDGDCDHTKKYIQMEIREYMTQLDKKISELQSLQARLISLNKSIAKDTENAYCCNLLSQLKGGE